MKKRSFLASILGLPFLAKAELEVPESQIESINVEWREQPHVAPKITFRKAL